MVSVVKNKYLSFIGKSGAENVPQAREIKELSNIRFVKQNSSKMLVAYIIKSISNCN